MKKLRPKSRITNIRIIKRHKRFIVKAKTTLDGDIDFESEPFNTILEEEQAFRFVMGYLDGANTALTGGSEDDYKKYDDPQIFQN